MYEKRFETSVQVEVNPCREVLSTESDNIKYCSSKSDPFYSKYPTGPAHVHQAGGDSATDSAIDMPADGSVSTINEIPPHHNMNNSGHMTSNGHMTNSGYKYTPTIADYSELQSDCSPSVVNRPSKYLSKPDGILGQSDLHLPVIYDYDRSPSNGRISANGEVKRGHMIQLQTFSPTMESRQYSAPSPNTRSVGNNRGGEDSVLV